MQHRSTHLPRRRRSGLGLVECMISLAIAVALLAAVAAAFVASSDAINENDEFFRATQCGRVALNRILTQARRGVVSTSSTSSSLRLITDTGSDVTYVYSSGAGTITLVTNSVTTDSDYVLARNLSSAQFDITTGANYAGTTAVTRVSVSLTVVVGNNQVLLSGSATPRRNFSL